MSYFLLCICKTNKPKSRILIEFCSTRNVLKEKTWIISPDSYTHSKQNDSFSCGVFICNFFEHMINNKREYLVNNFDLVAYRAKITNTLITKDN